MHATMGHASPTLTQGRPNRLGEVSTTNSVCTSSQEALRHKKSPFDPLPRTIRSVAQAKAMRLSNKLGAPRRPTTTSDRKLGKVNTAPQQHPFECRLERPDTHW
ncbi:hypothetical protein BASA60_009115 [Batrachochytrium salamandrivorans]|nr:hypothetical protein BASA60_009115 [Batrachochytrium salamandrivorans]